MMSRVCTLMLMTSVSLYAADRPNVVIILADDLGINDLGCYDRSEHKTPHLDRLASQGMKSTAAYAACPVCSPTRAALLTGKSPARLHLTTFLPGRGNAASQKLLHPVIQQQLPLTEVTLAERLKGAGYATACIGKWHLGHSPKEQGFDVVHAGKANTTPGPMDGGKGEYDLTEQAIKFVESNKDKPFFLYLAHNAPHIPLAARKPLVNKYEATFNPVYAAILHTLDDSVGQMLMALDRLGLANNTIVIFTSDNGGVHIPEGKEDCPTHNTPCRAGKGFIYEGGLRVPLIVRYPGVIPAGLTSDTPIISTDWTPTLLALCGMPSQDAFDGANMTDALKGKSTPERALFWHMPHYTNQGSRPAGAIREGFWKYIEHYEDGSVELYNLGRDPSESDNQVTRLAGVAEDFKTKLAKWRTSVSAQMNTPNPDFDAARHKAIYRDFDVSSLKAETTAVKTAEPLRSWRKLMDEAVKK